jgi:hypothetical protein
MTLLPKEQARLAELEHVIESGLGTIGKALAEIQRDRLYRATHSGFEQYVRERWNHSVSWAYRLIATERKREQEAIAQRRASFLRGQHSLETAGHEAKNGNVGQNRHLNSAELTIPVPPARQAGRLAPAPVTGQQCVSRATKHLQAARREFANLGTEAKPVVEVIDKALHLAAGLTINVETQPLRMAPQPTTALPGTVEKIGVMEYRVVNGQAPCHPLDGWPARLLAGEDPELCAVTIEEKERLLKVTGVIRRGEHLSAPTVPD